MSRLQNLSGILLFFRQAQRRTQDLSINSPYILLMKVQCKIEWFQRCLTNAGDGTFSSISTLTEPLSVQFFGLGSQRSSRC